MRLLLISTLCMIACPACFPDNFETRPPGYKAGGIHKKMYHMLRGRKRDPQMMKHISYLAGKKYLPPFARGYAVYLEKPEVAYNFAQQYLMAHKDALIPYLKRADSLVSGNKKLFYELLTSHIINGELRRKATKEHRTRVMAFKHVMGGDLYNAKGGIAADYRKKRSQYANAFAFDRRFSALLHLMAAYRACILKKKEYNPLSYKQTGAKGSPEAIMEHLYTSNPCPVKPLVIKWKKPEPQKPAPAAADPAAQPTDPQTPPDAPPQDAPPQDAPPQDAPPQDAPPETPHEAPAQDPGY